MTAAGFGAPDTTIVDPENLMEDAEFMLAAHERRRKAFWTWNGDEPRPQFSHRMSGGTIAIEPSIATLPPVSRIVFDGRVVSSGLDPERTAEMLAAGNYDDALPQPASKLGIPANLFDWNDLR
ncbi:hypothetical protein ACVDG5_008545 [Mesorhizobium sp. ORM6]